MTEESFVDINDVFLHNSVKELEVDSIIAKAKREVKIKKAKQELFKTITRKQKKRNKKRK